MVVLLTKSLLVAILKKIVHNINMLQFTDILIIKNWRSMYSWGGVNVLEDMCWLYYFSFAKVFSHRFFPLQGFNEAILKALKETQEYCTLFPSLLVFFPLGFPWQGFNEAYSWCVVIQGGVLYIGQHAHLSYTTTTCE